MMTIQSRMYEATRRFEGRPRAAMVNGMADMRDRVSLEEDGARGLWWLRSGGMRSVDMCPGY